MTCTRYWRRHRRCTSVKSRTGLHFHMRSMSPRPRSMRTSVMLGFPSNFFARPWQSAMKTNGWSGKKMSTHTSLPHRWSSLTKQARTIRPYTAIMDMLWLDVVHRLPPISCEEISLAWSPLFHWMDMKLCVFLRALWMGRIFWTLLSMMWCTALYILPLWTLLNHLPAAFNEPFPSGQEHSHSQQLHDPQNKGPSRNC